ncbi:hypothetical protein BJ165DRAFT_1599434 [Panaeolus papilionaceus]|nr:hypothetical protein BJ165DRAFT_1599434 [Panaeolus papilionaceus]
MSKPSAYNWIKVNGPLNCVPVDPAKYKAGDAFSLSVDILMGPTGAGKSSFVESLSSNPLSISKNSLDSVTQDVVCYKVVNLTTAGEVPAPVILMDTPGFLDTKLSEARILSMIASTLETLRNAVPTKVLIVSILYLHPITDIRLAGTKKISIDLLKTFAFMCHAEVINIVTTMWNTLWKSDQIDTANASSGFNLLKFEGSTNSALGILDSTHNETLILGPQLQKPMGQDLISKLSNILQERIANTQQNLRVLDEDHLNSLIAWTRGEEFISSPEPFHRDRNAAWETMHNFLVDLQAIDEGTYKELMQKDRSLSEPPSTAMAALVSELQSKGLIPPLAPGRRPVALAIQQPRDPVTGRRPLDQWSHPPVQVEEPQPSCSLREIGKWLKRNLSTPKFSGTQDVSLRSKCDEHAKRNCIRCVAHNPSKVNLRFEQLLTPLKTNAIHTCIISDVDEAASL